MLVVNEILQYLSTAAFLLLAVAIFRQWRQRRDEGSRWAFVTFGALSAVTVAALVLPQEGSDSSGYQWSVKALIALLCFIPYFLFRISAAFKLDRTRLRPAALLSTSALAVWALLLPPIPRPDESRPGAIQAWLIALAFLWVFLSTVVAVRFWRAGHGQSATARKRMNLLSVASVVFSLGIVITSFSPTGRDAGLRSITQFISLCSALLFYCVFAPPVWLRRRWRRPLEQRMQRQVLELVGSEDSGSVMDYLLSQAVEIVGGQGIALVDKHGQVIGSSGMDHAAIAEVEASQLDPQRHGNPTVDGLVHLEFPFGDLVIRTDAYTTFFGQEEFDLLGNLGAIANLAISRVEATDLRLQLQEAAIRRQQALAINDNVVQGLTVAQYALDVGELEKARGAIEGTLAAAQGIISGLVDKAGKEFGPGDLILGEPATGFMDRETTASERESKPGTAGIV